MGNKVQENIKNAIEKNNEKIEKLLENSHLTFTLNKEISELMDKNAALRENCKHEFEDGFCIWCGTSEEYNK